MVGLPLLQVSEGPERIAGMERLHRRRPSVELVNANHQLDVEKAKVAALKDLLAQHGIQFQEILHKVSSNGKVGGNGTLCDACVWWVYFIV